jgi:hypothetical protein
MTKPHKRLIAHLPRRAARRGRGETGTQLAALFARAGQILRHLRRRHARPAENEPQGGSSLPTGLRLVAQSLREAFAAHRRYHELRSKGIPHKTAIRLALGSPPGGPRE